MQYRTLGRTGWKVSAISFGAWAIGGSWGNVNDTESLAALNRAIDLGVNFIDTADVYGDGRSERLIAQLRRLRAVDQLKAICPAGMSMPQFALRWIIMFDAVTCAIPGAKRPSQAEDNFTAADLPPISSNTMQEIITIYDREMRPLVHHYW